MEMRVARNHSRDELSIALARGGRVVISIGAETLIRSILAGNYFNGVAAQITDRERFVGDVIRELLVEDEEGSNPVHILFDQAAVAAIEGGSQFIDIDEDTAA